MNPLKATAVANFNPSGIAANADAAKVSSEIRDARSKLLSLIPDPRNEVVVVDEAFTKYLSLLTGYIQAVGDGGDSKLRHAVKFRWTDSLTGAATSEQFDSIFEACHFCVNVASWYTKHAAFLAGSKEQPSEDEAKEVYRCLRKAGGIFSFVQASLIDKLVTKPDKPESDLDTRVLQAYTSQSIAEAQEVTIGRAIEQGQKPLIIGGLALETSRTFAEADNALESLNVEVTAKWRKYFQLKSAFYKSAAYSYYGDHLLSLDKCGEAIRYLMDSLNFYDQSAKLCAAYHKTRGPGTNCKPDQHLFFRKLRPLVQRTLDKCQRENGFIYHQKVPQAVGEPDMKADYGLVRADDFSLPQLSSWTEKAYGGFDLTRSLQAQQSGGKPAIESKDQKGDLPKVNEVEVPQAGQEPKNSSGCSVS